MQYALLIYGPAEDTDRAHAPDRRVPSPPCSTGRTSPAGPACTPRSRRRRCATTTGRMLLTDGPFIDSKEYLAGLILIEADNLDGALAIAEELLQETRPGSAIEVRPVLDGRFRGA